MVGETVTETWFSTILKSSRKSLSWEPERPVLGILAFEVSRFMSKVVNLWQCLTDRQIVRLREEIANAVGIQKLVSEDEDYLMDLALAEIIENVGSVAKSVAMLGKKCADPTYHNLENVFNDPGEIDPKWYGWQYRLKKMEKKVKKMEKFVAATEQLYSELEVLAELEQSLRRMRAGANLGKVKLLEFQQKVVWQRQEVKNLQEMSPWVRPYDYIVRLLLRSLFTIIERIKYVYGVNQIENVVASRGYGDIHGVSLIRSNSMSALLQTGELKSANLSENNASRLPVPVERSFSNLGLGGDKSKLKNRKSQDHSPSSVLCGKPHQMKARRFTPVGFAGCMTGGSESPVVETYAPSCGSSFRSNGASQKDADEIKDICPIPIIYSSITPKESFFNSKSNLLNAPPSTLGHAALALHYANVIILIEKLASSPHLISLDARDDLYNLLPSTIRSCLRAKLKTFSKSMASSVYDPAFAAEWGLAVARILEWLSPLAHNMIRWQSERNFERQRLIFGSNVLLVQTLYFADRVRTEAAIVELLMGLNYLFRFGREINERPFRESSCSRAYDGYLIPRDKTRYNMIDHTA
ncbi:UNVERIFIED_CONTAM: protein PSK SIMULATOR 1 [Sesamum latifolium]|uniref:Protein PSK SIMULATOR 1 n=1 Tax=Sesamum latifolium TaxID=2727402 RepID=A0AAW2TYB0_9LAMI